MDYSVIIPYRNREKHLLVLLPRLQEVFRSSYGEVEFIVSEQDNNDNFQIACVENVGAKLARGSILIFHQVDYYPLNDVDYHVRDMPVLPAKIGIHLNDAMTDGRAYEDIPAGYRNWSHEIDPNFYGGIICMTRSHFETINGFNPMYRGWGNEDEDLRERFKWAGIPVKRNETGTFYVLYHKDNCPSPQDADRYRDFAEGRMLLHRAYEYRNVGYKNLKADVKEYTVEEGAFKGVRWITSTNYIIDGGDTNGTV